MNDWELALDPATVTGWALWRGDELLSGTWDLSPRRGDGAGMRFLRIQAKLDELARSYALRRIVYEQPGHFKSAAADDVVRGLVSHIQSWCESNRVPCEGVSPTSVKKFATRNGNANKQAMTAAARIHWPLQQVADCNQADALWIMQYAKAM